MLKRKGYLGFLGFLALGALQFSSTKDITYLCNLAYLGFFSYFWIAKISGSTPDERYYENVKSAKAFIGNIAVFEIAAIFVAGVLLSAFREYLIVVISLCFASLLIAYAVKLYTLEEK